MLLLKSIYIIIFNHFNYLSSYLFFISLWIHFHHAKSTSSYWMQPFKYDSNDDLTSFYGARTHALISAVDILRIIHLQTNANTNVHVSRSFFIAPVMTSYFSLPFFSTTMGRRAIVHWAFLCTSKKESGWEKILHMAYPVYSETSNDKIIILFRI